MTKTQKKQKEQDKIQNWNMNISLGLAAIFLAIIIMLGIVFSQPVHLEAEGWCNSGNVKLDIAAQNIVQNHTCMEVELNESGDRIYVPADAKYGQNMTCFKENLVLDHAALNGIEGLNCQGTVKTDMPFILAWFMR